MQSPTLKNPIPGCNWLVADKILVGESPSKDTFYALVDAGVNVFISLMTEAEHLSYGDYRPLARLYGCTILEYPVEDGGTFVMKVLEDAVAKVLEILHNPGEKDLSELTAKLSIDESAASNGGKRPLIYIHCYGGHGRSAVLGACFLQAYFRINADDSISLVQKAHQSREKLPRVATPQTAPQMTQIRAYRRPYTVAISGDRHSSVAFSDFIITELKRLPRHSVVLVGDCKGVDKNATDLCYDLGIEVRVYKAQWANEGMAAGPIRNKKMLDANPDYILAFHPDITESKGTLNMVTQALIKKIPVWLHDCKKSRLIRRLEDLEECKLCDKSH